MPWRAWKPLWKNDNRSGSINERRGNFMKTFRKDRGLTFDEFEIGAQYCSQRRTVTEADVVSFAGLSGDFNPLHTDAEFGRQTPFGERIAHGMLIVAIATGMANWTGICEATSLALVEQLIRYK